MAGIYIHIPYCKQKCSYCNFYFSVSTKTKNDLIPAILSEIDLNYTYLLHNEIDSIYFGGGTPSILPVKEIEAIINRLNKYYKFNPKIEITLEANPDDINIQYLKDLKKVGINRFSMGVQSFIDEELLILNRYHDSTKAEYSIKLIQDNQFENMNIDLIFGIPQSTMRTWNYNLEKFLELDIPHLSCYNLTIEKKTAIYHQIKTGKLEPQNEELSTEMFLKTFDILSNNDFEHYEISNYAKDKAYALHNTNYWKGIPYLGIGPSAHSFNTSSRQWNVANNRKYIKLINEGVLPFEKEILSANDRFNEYVMTGLRTMWGIKLSKLEVLNKNSHNKIEQEIRKNLDKGFLKQTNDTLFLTRKGKLFADKVASDLFI